MVALSTVCSFVDRLDKKDQCIQLFPETDFYPLELLPAGTFACQKIPLQISFEIDKLKTSLFRHFIIIYTLIFIIAWDNPMF